MSVMKKQGKGTSKWTIKREHHNDRSRAETPSDPMHPNGRCECGGEGECSWCAKFRGEDVEIDLDDLGEPEPGFYTKFMLGAPSVPAIETEEDANRMFGKNSNAALDAIAHLEKVKGQQADRRVVEAMDTMRPPGVPFSEETANAIWQVDAPPLENFAPGAFVTPGFTRTLTSDASTFDAGEFSREEAGANLARLNARVRELEIELAATESEMTDALIEARDANSDAHESAQNLKIITEERDEYQRALVELRQEFEAMRVDRNEHRADVMRLEKQLDPLLDELRDVKTDRDHARKCLADWQGTKTVDVDEQLFLIWREGGAAPTKPHSSFESARAEASRLAKANAGHRFYVLGAVGNAKTPKVEAEFVLSDGRFDDREEIPF